MNVAKRRVPFFKSFSIISRAGAGVGDKGTKAKKISKDKQRQTKTNSQRQENIDNGQAAGETTDRQDKTRQDRRQDKTKQDETRHQARRGK